MPLEDPSDNYITDLNHVHFGIPGGWNPDNENDNDDDDFWFDAALEDEEMIDAEFLDSHDGWNLFPGDLKINQRSVLFWLLIWLRSHFLGYASFLGVEAYLDRESYFLGYDKVCRERLLSPISFLL